MNHLRKLYDIFPVFLAVTGLPLLYTGRVWILSSLLFTASC
ncbi:hypothetical protein HMPREF0322_02517 [Desulfitobacterium hafniense DP7]|uniref:Uncharacterized protein n=1 Tax=Desulfitobacterium hafniense DP7 TaxID=537010 RepID=G9XNH5_DESHA|nr:hypothetical protein HMPREF0322_02517 [Desulfitobacterium hafniense DP7]